MPGQTGTSTFLFRRRQALLVGATCGTADKGSTQCPGVGWLADMPLPVQLLYRYALHVHSVQAATTGLPSDGCAPLCVYMQSVYVDV